MRKILSRILVCLLAFSALSCSDNPKKRVIGLSLLTTRNPFFNIISEAAKEEAAKHGFELVTVSGEFDSGKQRAQVKDFIVQEVSAIILCPTDAKAVGTAIKDANKAGIPVFTADLGCLDPEAKVVSHIATDNYLGGKQAGEAMIEALGDEGGKIIILHFAVAESCQLRVKGFREVIDKHNKETKKGKITVEQVLPGGGDKDISYQSTLSVLPKIEDVRGIFAINDPSALGAHAALEKKNKTQAVTIVGFDGQIEGKQAIKEGKIYADPIQYPKKIGRETVKMIVKYLNGEKVPKELLIEPSLYRQADALKDPDLK